MINVTSLVIKYKKDKNPATLNEIMSHLHPVIKQKAKYIFKKKYFPYSLYHKCKSCQHCKTQNNLTCLQHIFDHLDCPACSCIKGTFNLSKIGTVDYVDIEHDLIMEVMRLINNFDITKDFNVYLFATLWKWNPSFLTESFIQELNHTEFKEEIMNNIITEKPEGDFLLRDFIDEVVPDKRDREILRYLCEEKLDARQIAKKMGLSKTHIYNIINKLRKKLKKMWTNPKIRVYLLVKGKM